MGGCSKYETKPQKKTLHINQQMKYKICKANNKCLYKRGDDATERKTHTNKINILRIFPKE